MVYILFRDILYRFWIELNPPANAPRPWSVGWRMLIREGRVQMLGPIRQELLSGIREEAQHRKLRDYLRAFQEHPLEAADYEEAVHMNNRCRAKGIAGSPVDFLICATAHRRGWTILTTDRDFQNYASVLPLHLHAATPTG